MPGTGRLERPDGIFGFKIVKEIPITSVENIYLWRSSR